jgi:hypothetical protein
MTLLCFFYLLFTNHSFCLWLTEDYVDNNALWVVDLQLDKVVCIMAQISTLSYIPHFPYLYIYFAYSLVLFNPCIPWLLVVL